MEIPGILILMLIGFIVQHTVQYIVYSYKIECVCTKN